MCHCQTSILPGLAVEMLNCLLVQLFERKLPFRLV